MASSKEVKHVVANCDGHYFQVRSLRQDNLTFVKVQVDSDYFDDNSELEEWIEQHIATIADGQKLICRILHSEDDVPGVLLHQFEFYTNKSEESISNFTNNLIDLF